ncbi:jg13820 [Pararge aegeria aegeria]|uniref:Jg13820 protein n=1 Tax=Pararge aegeria aegeria TaxID=348720 RepID=A0A8S4S609_9NEOP|nr:jg13820 [Pararge aegeria aegeria]
MEDYGSQELRRQTELFDTQKPYDRNGWRNGLERTRPNRGYNGITPISSHEGMALQSNSLILWIRWMDEFDGSSVA